MTTDVFLLPSPFYFCCLFSFYSVRKILIQIDNILLKTIINNFGPLKDNLLLSWEYNNWEMLLSCLMTKGLSTVLSVLTGNS